MEERTATYDEAFNASKKYFNDDVLAAKVFVDKYALRDKANNFYEKTPDDMHKRLAKEFSRIEKKYPNPMSEQEIYNLFKGFKYVCAQGSPMSAIGNPFQLQSAGNCFVIESPHDSYGGICKTDQEMAQLMKRRAGVGVNISNIRPKGLSTNNAAKTTDGIGIFMERFSNTCREVAQSGRRGALLLALNCHHPEIDTFINIKQDLSKVTGANISILLTDEFMQAVKNNEKVRLRWPLDSKPEIEQLVDARNLWNRMIDAAWSSAEPGLLFSDNIKRNSIPHLYSNLDDAFSERATNPCGEIPMGTDSCRLILLNVFSFVDNAFKSDAKFNYDLFFEIVVKAQRLMDDLVDLEVELIDKILAKIEADPEPLNVKKIELDLWKEFRRVCILGRRTGLGVTGIGDTLASLGIKYGSNDSINITEKIYKTLALGAHRSSSILAKERGSFEIFDYKLENDSDCEYIHRIWDADPKTHAMVKKYGRRNIALTTTAPCGSVSILTQTTSGIEPVFRLHYTRRKKINPDTQESKTDFIDALGDHWQEFEIYHHHLNTWMKVVGEDDIKKSPYFEATSADIDWVSKVKLQAAAQKWISHAISNTTNIPKEATKKVVSDIYMAGYDLGCKGVTVYRDGSRDGVLITNTTKKADENGRPLNIMHTEAPKRPIELMAEIHHAIVNKVKWTVIVGLLHGEPYELFMGKSENFDIPVKYTEAKIVRLKRGVYNLLSAQNEVLVEDVLDVANTDEGAWITRLMSMSLRHGVSIEYLADQLSKDGCVVDLNKVLARLLKKYVKKRDEKSDEMCPACGGYDLVYEEGCKRCIDTNCGWAGCG